MNYQITTITLITDSNRFNFSNYAELCSFEQNNPHIIAESYTAVLSWDDNTTTTQTYDGINASALLASEFCQDTAEEIEFIERMNR
jgi:hypothetical protein